MGKSLNCPGKKYTAMPMELKSECLFPQRHSETLERGCGAERGQLEHFACHSRLWL